MVQSLPRARLALAIALLAGFFGFIVLAAFAPATLARPSFGGVPLSFEFTTGLIAGTIAVTGLYALAANAAETRR